ncbi:MAG: hypothetical protein HKP58_01040 [Desulfatitalea sp.]|nr:hypothetical protein [Desulfatitalea sp.]NNJ98971.1 hypothetical protein [Desulfatitalea sp.]
MTPIAFLKMTHKLRHSENKRVRYMQRLRDAWLVFCFIVAAILLLNTWHYKSTFSNEKIDAAFEPITSKYGIKIVYEVSDDYFFPEERTIIPAGPPRSSKIKPIYRRVLVRYPRILQKAFDKYPVDIIKRYLNAIYFAGEIDDGEAKYAGTLDPFRRIVYLVDNGYYDDEQAISTFHHEFCTMLLRSHSFYVNPWTDNHPKDFKYLWEIYDAWEEVREARLSVTDEYCYERGIVTNYGLTTFSNDLSEYSSMIFTYPEKFKKIMNQYPRVRGKFLVWLEFYQKIDPIFTEAYLLGEK